MEGMSRDEVIDVLKRFAQMPQVEEDLRVDIDSYCSRKFDDYVYELDDIGSVLGTYPSSDELPPLEEDFPEASIEELGEEVVIKVNNGENSSTPHVNHPVKLKLNWYILTEDEEEEERVVVEIEFLHNTDDGEFCRVDLDNYLMVSE